MTPETTELVRFRLVRAAESLAEAKLLFENDHVQTAVNRMYYACFYAVSALLLTEGYFSPKHSGIRALFDQHWIAPGRLPKHMGRLYRRLFDSRQQADYTDLSTFDPAETRLWLEEAGAFVERIRQSLKEGLESNQGKAQG